MLADVQKRVETVAKGRFDGACVSSLADVQRRVDAVAEAAHMSHIAEELGLKTESSLAPVKCDSKGAIGYLKNGGNGKSRMKHIDLRSDWVKEMRSKKVDVQFVGTADNQADPFTKLMNGPTLARWAEINMATTED